jgi:hypothetical protein
MNPLTKTAMTSCIGICYGHVLLFLSDIGLVLLHGQEFTAIFSKFKWFSYALMGAYGHVFLFDQFARIYRFDQETQPFDWKIGLPSIFYLGLFYSSLIVYPSEVAYSLLVQSDPFLYDRIFLGFPCGIVTLCLFELSSMNQRIYDMLRIL